MTSKVSGRSILKSQSSTPTVSEEDAKVDRERRNRGVALFHANKIQAQKDIGARILSNIETLLDWPSSTPFTTNDATTFITLITPFQPSDFDSLTEERRNDGRCGRALCANQPRATTLGESAAWKLKGKGAGDYCSNECLRRALYVRTQLTQVPAWEREAHQQPHIVLPEGDRVGHVGDTATTSTQHSTNIDHLALERGEATLSFRSKQVMMDDIVEKAPTPTAPSKPTVTAALPHDSIEGYVPAWNTIANPPSDEKMKQTDLRAAKTRRVTHNEPNEEGESWEALYQNLSDR